MNTNQLKTFATKARLILIEGVTRKLNYWGFDEQGICTEEMEKIPGGYTFRERVFNDTRVYPKWQNLKRHVRDPQTRKDVIEQAAYTWFNRLIAIKMLEVNGYEPELIAYRESTHAPLILQTAKRGGITPYYKVDQELLKQYFLDDEDEPAFGLLLTNHCNRHSLLKNIFGSIDDFTELLLPNNLLAENGIIALINDPEAINTDDFKEVELIGWLYQFYIADRKDEVFAGFKKNKKARAEDIPAATQIFTPKWIVKYMVENTVGKLYLDYEPSSPIKEEMKYLVENKSEEQGNAKPLISDITELTLLDPACGSGHILVVGFELLMKMYLEQGYHKKQAIQHILKHNLFGLDIDERAAQLARFALLMKAAAYDLSILAENLHVNVYAFPEAHHFTREDLLTFLDDQEEYLGKLSGALKLLNQGKNIGSALKLDLSPEAVQHLKTQVKKWRHKEASASLGFLEQAIWNGLKPFLEVLMVLTKQYTSVAANPPYMGQKSMNAELKEYVNKHYPFSKSDLFAVFMEVCLNLSSKDGLMGMINQHSWMFLSSYEKLRQELTANYGIVNMLHLGSRTFPELSGEVVQSVAFVFDVGMRFQHGTYYRLVDYGNSNLKEEKFLLRNNEYIDIPQSNFPKIPGSPIVYWVPSNVYNLFIEGNLLGKKLSIKSGLSTGDNSRFVRAWFEISFKLFTTDYIDCVSKDPSLKWVPYSKGGGIRKWYGNNELVVDWFNNAHEIRELGCGVFRNESYYFKPGITWSGMSSTCVSFRYSNGGFVFDSNKGPMIFSFDKSYSYDFLLGFLNNKPTNYFLNIVNPTVSTQIGDVSNLPLIEVPKDKVGEIELNARSNLEIACKDWDSREISWDFEKSPLLNDCFSIKQAFQNWQEYVTQDFIKIHANEEQLNRIFIDVYDLKEELTSDVDLNDITILQDELDHNKLEQFKSVFRKEGKDAILLPLQKDMVMTQLISYAVGCMMGRYRLDKPGLNVAHPNPTDEQLSDYTYMSRPWNVDKDAIIPMMGSESPFADDIVYRTKGFVRVVWGDESLTENLNFLQECLGMDLEKFLVNKFWDYHKRMYKKRPIYWLFSSKKGAFQVLTYMHRMDKYTVQIIRQNYLHRYQAWLSEQVEKLSVNEAGLSRQDQKKLESYRKAQLECKEYDEILKELAKEQIEFDLDDGVVVNYAKFGEAVKKL